MTELIILLGVVGIIIVIFLLRPPPYQTLVSRPNPAGDYREALHRISTLRNRERTTLIPDARLRLMTHGRRTEQAIVLVHGYTNCARQFAELGKRFHAAGYNVLIATFPHHGLPDRMTREQERLTAEELAAYADEMTDIAQGLGKRVTFAGLSCGGVVSAWIWANRPDIHMGAIMAPAFGMKAIPWWLTEPAVNLFSILPNFYGSFDPARTPKHCYPRFSTRALTQIMRLGYAARRRAENRLQPGKPMIVIMNQNDWAVNNDLTMRVVDRWRRLGADVTVHEFDASWKLDHDFIEPTQPNQPTGRVYPLLVEWIAGKKPSPKKNFVRYRRKKSGRDR